jgi:hypothetical protein
MEYGNLITTNVGNFRGCLMCPSGKYQDSSTQTSCKLCNPGHFDNTGLDGSKLHDQQCSHCPNGRFQHAAGALECYDCPSGKFSENGHVHHTCLSCTVYAERDSTSFTDGVERIYWTRNLAGWSECEKKALDCKFGVWPDIAAAGDANGGWDTCTKSCKHTVTDELGDQQRLVAPIYHSWGDLDHTDALLRPRHCNATGIVGDASSQTFVRWEPFSGAVNALGNRGEWRERRTCNHHYCPVDCIPSPWTAWDQCTVSCNGGSTTKTRTVVQYPVHGGKGCPGMTLTKPCNTHQCVHSECHTQHIRCEVKFHQYGAQSSCLTPDCHECDSALECAQKGLMRTIEVTHDKRFSHINADFKCHVEDADGVIVSNKHEIPEDRKLCKCRCSDHPTACDMKNLGLRNAGYIHGNMLKGVENVATCSNLCSHNPECKSWEFKSNLECTLSAAIITDVTTGYAPNTDSYVTTYAGATTGTDGCLHADHEVVCPTGKFRYVSEITDLPFCFDCPVGETSYLVDSPSCTTIIAHYPAPLIETSSNNAAKLAEYRNNKLLPYPHYEPLTFAPTAFPTSAPTTYPTHTDASLCCSEYVASCLSCKAQMTEDNYCFHFPATAGC